MSVETPKPQFSAYQAIIKEPLANQREWLLSHRQNKITTWGKLFAEYAAERHNNLDQSGFTRAIDALDARVLSCNRALGALTQLEQLDSTNPKYPTVFNHYLRLRDTAAFANPLTPQQEHTYHAIKQTSQLEREKKPVEFSIDDRESIPPEKWSVIFQNQRLPLSPVQYNALVELFYSNGQTLTLDQLKKQSFATSTQSPIDVVEELKNILYKKTGRSDVVKYDPTAQTVTIPSGKIKVDFIEDDLPTTPPEDKQPDKITPITPVTLIPVSTPVTKELPIPSTSSEKNLTEFELGDNTIRINGKNQTVNPAEKRLLKLLLDPNSSEMTPGEIASKMEMSLSELNNMIKPLAATIKRLSNGRSTINIRPGESIKITQAQLIEPTSSSPAEQTPPSPSTKATTQLEQTPAPLSKVETETDLTPLPFEVQEYAALGAIVYSWTHFETPESQTILTESVKKQLEESARLLTHELGGKTPAEMLAYLPLRNLTEQDYQKLRVSILKDLVDIHTTKNQWDTQSLSDNQKTIVEWIFNLSQDHLIHFISHSLAMNPDEVKTEHYHFGHSWQKNTSPENKIFQTREVLTSAELKRLEPTLDEARKIAYSKSLVACTPSGIERAYKEPGRKISPINRSKIQIYTKCGIITPDSAGSFKQEDVEILVFLLMTVPGKQLRSKYTGEKLRLALQQIRTKLQTTQSEKTNDI